MKILISSKDFDNSKAEPADVQEWAAVVKAMNDYSAGTRYVGLIVSPSGFTRGCEPWASAYNLGLIPPLKGKRLNFPLNTTIQMFERVLGAFDKRIHFPHEILFEPHISTNLCMNSLGRLKEETKQLETLARDISYFQKSGYLHSGRFTEPLRVSQSKKLRLPRKEYA